jgi:hypothetical protein
MAVEAVVHEALRRAARRRFVSERDLGLDDRVQRGVQPVLFKLTDDRRPASQRTAAGRYSEPMLFDSVRMTRATSRIASRSKGSAGSQFIPWPVRRRRPIGT